MNVGLNPPEETEDEELAEVVWRALQSVKLARTSERERPGRIVRTGARG